MNLNKVLTGGKFKGKTIGEVMSINPGYIKWAKENAPGLLKDVVEKVENETTKSKKDYLWVRSGMKENTNFLNEKD